MPRIYVKAKEDDKSIIDKIMAEKGLSQEDALSYLINKAVEEPKIETRASYQDREDPITDGKPAPGLAGMTEHAEPKVFLAPETAVPIRAPPNVSPEPPLLDNREFIEVHVSSDGSTLRFIPCIYGAYDTDGCEVSPEVRLRITSPAKCPFLTERPKMSLKELQNDYCKKSRETERCPILSDWIKWRVFETAAKLKQQQYREKLQSIENRTPKKPAQLSSEAAHRWNSGQNYKESLADLRSEAEKRDDPMFASLKDDTYENWRKRNQASGS